MAKTRWVNVQFPVGGQHIQHNGFDIHEIEVFYSDTGAICTEFGVFKASGGNMNILGHFPALQEAKDYADKIKQFFP